MELQLPIYLDNNATTQCDPRVVDVMLPYFTRHFGNAASKDHPFGWAANEAVEFAREQVAALLQASPTEIVFTSGATESVNLALKGVYEAYASRGNHIITFTTEHKAVLDSCKHLERLGASITYLPVHEDGTADTEALENAINDKTILVCLMYANNETGVIQPIKEVSAIAHRYGSLFFSDATQAVGKIPVDVQADGIDILAMSGHKLYGPKGVGALYVRRKDPRVRIAAQIDGGGHERGMRSGTLNVPGIAGLGKACAISMAEMNEENNRLSFLRGKLETALLQLNDTHVNGNIMKRLPHVSNLAFGGVHGGQVMAAINKNIAVSSGSACTSAVPEPSYVLKAMGLSDDMANSSLRFAVGRFTTEAEIDYTIQLLTDTVNSQRAKSMAVASDLETSKK